MTMHLITFWDYFAAWVLLYVLFQILYRVGCAVAKEPVDDDTCQGIFGASVCIIVCLWAVRQLLF